MPITPPFFEAGEDAPLEHVFSGTYFQKIDKFYRISLPKELRRVPSSNNSWILWRSNYVNAIEATTEKVFSSTVTKNLVPSSDEKERIRQIAEIYADVYKIYDSNGRLTIPPSLRIDLKFEDYIVILGMGAFFHIWPSAEYEKFYVRRVGDEHAEPASEPPTYRSQR